VKISLAVLVFLLAASHVAGQAVPIANESRSATFVADPTTFGTVSETIYTIFAYEFQPFQYGTTWSESLFHRFVTTSDGCCLEAGVRLPNGAAIIGYDIEGQDHTDVGEIKAGLATCSIFGFCGYVGPRVMTGVAAMPGAGRFRVNLPVPLTVDNFVNTYFFEYTNPGESTVNAAFRAARVYYKLQVSPSPVTATFTDVPTNHVFFQFIEALASSGITTGCSASPPQFCPNATLTRGQMAVFLAKALGLHFPN
jgi:hypothetical protein